MKTAKEVMEEFERIVRPEGMYEGKDVIRWLVTAYLDGYAHCKETTTQTMKELVEEGK